MSGKLHLLQILLTTLTLWSLYIILNVTQNCNCVETLMPEVNSYDPFTPSLGAKCVVLVAVY